MLMELQGKGAKVYRAATKFSAANHAFLTGAALVDGTTITQRRHHRDRDPA